MMPTCCFTAFLLLAGCGAAVPAGNTRPPEPTVFPAEIQGAWQEIDGENLLRVEPDRLVAFEAKTGSLTVRGLENQDASGFVLRKAGLPETWSISTSGQMLHLERRKSETDPVPYLANYRRLYHLPQQLDLRQLPLPAPRTLPEETIRSIQNEVQRRFDEEQAILKDPAREKEFEPARKSNLTYLETTLRDVGWLDAERFGSRTSMQAIFMAKHTNDLRLMLTILPHAEKEFKRAGRSQTYAILYDAVQLDLGHKQRYGTQVTEDKSGEPFVLPLEDPARVDEYLGEIGLPPLSNYLTEVSNAFYKGKKKVRVARREDG